MNPEAQGNPSIDVYIKANAQGRRGNRVRLFGILVLGIAAASTVFQFVANGLLTAIIVLVVGSLIGGMLAFIGHRMIKNATDAVNAVLDGYSSPHQR